MDSGVGAGVRVALNRPRVLGVVVIAVALEAAVRLPLAVVHPVLAVVVPPVFAAAVLGGSLPGVRRAVADPAASIPVPWARLRADGAALVGLAVVGHVVALAVGAAGFLLLDTPIRYAWYAAGNGPPPLVAILGPPLPAVAIGAFAAWALFGPAAVAAVIDDGSLTPVRTALASAAARPRQTWIAIGLNLLAAVGIGTAVVAGLWLTRGTRDLTPTVLVAATIVVPVALVATLFLYPIHAALVDDGSVRSAPGVGRLAVAGLLVTGLVVGAGVVRVTETRPTVDAAALPEDPSAAYAVAVENTLSQTHRVAYRSVRGEEAERYRTVAVDRGDRRFEVEYPDSETPSTYGSTGAAYYGLGRADDTLVLGERAVRSYPLQATPGYFEATTTMQTRRPKLPAPETGRWRTVDRANGNATVELTGDDAVAMALYDSRLDAYETARIRMRIDSDRGVVTGGQARLNGTDGNRRIDLVETYAVETGETVDVTRPDALGPPMPGEWLWRLFAY